MMPPALQLKASQAQAPIQRVVVDEDGNPLKYSQMKKAIAEAGYSIDTSESELKSEFKALQSDERYENSFDELIDYLLKEKMISKSEKDDDTEPAEEELKSVKKKRTGTPKSTFDLVYKPNKSNVYYRGKGSKNGQKAYIYECGLKCGFPLYLNQQTMHEIGFYKGSKMKTQKPPVCHSSEYPADYTTLASESIYSNETGIKDLSAIRTRIMPFVQKLHWSYHPEFLMPGHTSCNSSHKDKPYKSLDKKRKREYEGELEDHLDHVRKKRKLDTIPDLLEQ